MTRFLGVVGAVTPPGRLNAAVQAAVEHAAAAAGVSASLLSLADHRVSFADGRPLDRLGDEEVIEALSSIKGVGRWTAQMFLLFRLGRPNVLPAEDLGIRKGVQLTYRTRGLPPPKRVLAIGRPWAPYASVASWYLWRCLELPPAPRA